MVDPSIPNHFLCQLILLILTAYPLAKRAQDDLADTLAIGIPNEQAVPLHHHTEGLAELGGGVRSVQAAVRAACHGSGLLGVGSERMQELPESRNYRKYHYRKIRRQ